MFGGNESRVNLCVWNPVPNNFCFCTLVLVVFDCLSQTCFIFSSNRSASVLEQEKVIILLKSNLLQNSMLRVLMCIAELQDYVLWMYISPDRLGFFGSFFFPMCLKWHPIQYSNESTVQRKNFRRKSCFILNFTSLLMNWQHISTTANGSTGYVFVSHIHFVPIPSRFLQFSRKISISEENVQEQKLFKIEFHIRYDELTMLQPLKRPLKCVIFEKISKN